MCSFYIIWKLHKAANAFGLRSRPIAAAIDYVTGPVSHFLHSQVKEAVWKHCPKGLVGTYPDRERAGALDDCTSMVYGKSHQFQPDSQGPVPEAGTLRIDKQLRGVC